MARRTKEQIRTDRAKADAAESRARQAQHREGSQLGQAQRKATPKPATGPVKGARRSLRQILPGHPPTALIASEAVTLTALVGYDFLGPNADGTGRMPDPRPIVATLGFWTLLGLVGSIGDSLATGVAWVGWILTSTVLVVGPRGQGLVLFVRKLATTALPVNPTY